MYKPLFEALKGNLGGPAIKKIPYFVASPIRGVQQGKVEKLCHSDLFTSLDTWQSYVSAVRYIIASGIVP